MWSCTGPTFMWKEGVGKCTLRSFPPLNFYDSRVYMQITSIGRYATSYESQTSSRKATWLNSSTVNSSCTFETVYNLKREIHNIGAQ